MKYFYSAYHTDKGIKKKTNQDSLLLKGIADETNEVFLAVICDGMGGMEKGELASAEVVRAFSEWFEVVYTQKGVEWTAEEIRHQWEKMLVDINETLITYGEENGIQLGTTVTAALISATGQYLIGHVGDTRAYQINNQGVEQLTEDHTFVAREVRRGTMTLEQAAQDNRRNVLLQCIGVNKSFKPQFLEGNLDVAEAFLLCSDGFRHVVSEEEIYECLRPDKFQDEAVIKQELIRLVELNKKRLETDNISAIYIKRR